MRVPGDAGGVRAAAIEGERGPGDGLGEKCGVLGGDFGASGEAFGVFGEVRGEATRDWGNETVKRGEVA